MNIQYTFSIHLQWTNQIQYNTKITLIINLLWNLHTTTTINSNNKFSTATMAQPNGTVYLSVKQRMKLQITTETPHQKTKTEIRMKTIKKKIKQKQKQIQKLEMGEPVYSKKSLRRKKKKEDKQNQSKKNTNETNNNEGSTTDNDDQKKKM